MRSSSVVFCQLSLFFFLPSVVCAVAQQVALSGGSASVILGVLEDTSSDTAGRSSDREIREMFQKKGDRWRAFPTQTKSYNDLQNLPKAYPARITWTVVFSGRKLGELTTETPARYQSYAEIGLAPAISKGTIPSAGKRVVDSAGSSKSVFRPLVTVSEPNYMDPDEWRKAQPSMNSVTAAREEFRNRFPSISNCKNAEDNVPRKVTYHASDIKVRTAYSSNDHWSLLELGLDGYACDGPTEQEGAFAGHWYVISRSGELKYLGSNMKLVDAGDYDKSGHSQVLFAMKGYNTGGYRLFYRAFKQSIQFEFYYH